MKNFVVYKSSAGSGKTFTLVKEYLRLALHDEKKLSHNYRRILAVTFTNKAAAEMKNRVIGALDQIANKEELPFTGKLLCDEINITEAELKERAGFVLGHILHHYSDLSIGTIDSFTHKIVKTFAHDLKLPVNFNIELDTEGFYEKVIASVFNQIGEDEYIGRLLKEYALTRAQDNAGWDPEKQIQEFAKLLLKENSDSYIAQLRQFETSELEVFRKQFLDFVRHYKATLRTEAQKAIDLIRNNGLSDQDFIYKNAGPQNFFLKCLDNTVTLENTEKGRIIDAITKNKWAGNDAGNHQQILESITPELNAITRSLIGFIRENYSYFSLCEVLGKQMYPLMLLKKIEEISLEQKQEERLVFISEFNSKISEIIHNEPTPFIYERLGERYRHYLLDEFQDTSSLQWHNILPLLDNSLSSGWFNLIVGDGKQSIYRWRNANVKQFASLPEIENITGDIMIAERTESLKRNFLEKVLNTNYRSTGTIVEFNNALFGALSNKLLSGDSGRVYENQAQRINQDKNAGGYVSIHTGQVVREEMDIYNCNVISEQIAAALRDGFEHKDICILARKNYHGNIIANYLMKQKIPVVSSDSLLLKNNLEVNTIVCYLSYLVNKEDKISATSVINYLFQSGQIGEDDLHTCLSGLSKGKSLFDIFKSCGIALRESDLSLNNLFDHCVEIIKAMHLDKNGHHYIRFFLDEVNEFLVLKNSSISSFFDWWHSRSNRASMVIPENTDAVRIMTIHASKGLEFPVVIVPYCNWGVYLAGDSWVQVKNEKVELPVSVISLTKKAGESGFEKEFEAEQQNQVLDNLNLLYVAFTRAVERLHVISVSSFSSRSVSVSDWIGDFTKAQGAQKADQDGTAIFQAGNPAPRQSRQSSAGLPDFDLLPLAFTTPKNVVRIKASYLNNSEYAEAAKQQGLRIHWLLSRIRTVEDRDSALASALLEGLIAKSELTELREKLNQLLEHPQLSPFFQPGIDCKLEAELITQSGELLRPDRILFHKEEATLIDYKTGKENNKVYFSQLYKYESALLSMGYTGIKKLLVYIDEMKIVVVN